MAVSRVVGVDVGGTYTDLVVLRSGSMWVHKVASTPDDPARAVLDGLAQVDPEGHAEVAHGTTVATNALLQRRGARTAFVATAGFGDLLRLGRGERDDLYALEPRSRDCLVPAELTYEVVERLASDGTEVVPLDRASLLAAARDLGRAGVEAVAVCLLFSYLDSRHEREVGRMLARHGPEGLYVSLSAAVAPEFREYERASTTVVNAFVGPTVARYLRDLEDGLRPRRLWIMGSHAGTLAAAEAALLPVATVLSGPAAGVTGAVAVGRRCGYERLLTLDMGGTSTDVALCAGEAPFASAITVAGLLVHRPTVDVHTVGAGGGSYVRIDEGGALRVGPESAGAVPGPASYGRGGHRPTVTDANVVLGRLPTDRPLAGGLRLDGRAAREALAPIAQRLGLDVERTALGVLAVVNAAMERALRRVSVERGHDPRQHILVAFGGAGPVHACALADLLGIAEVLVPIAPGALSALGLAVAPPATTVSRSVLRARGVAADVEQCDAVFAALEAQAAASMHALEHSRCELSVDARYAGQSWELTLPWPGTLDALREAFHEAHRVRHGHDRTDAPVEVVTLRVRLVGGTPAELPSAPPPEPDWAGRQRLILDDGRTAEAPALSRSALVRGEGLVGPALVTQLDATTYVAPGWRAEVGSHGDLKLRRTTS